MPHNEAMCRHFIHLHDVFKAQADQIQKLVDETVAQLDGVLVGPYRTGFLDDMKNATSIDDQIAAAKSAVAHIMTDLRKLMDKIYKAAKAGVPADPWPSTAQKLLADLEALLRALKMLRELEAAMGSHVADWCR